MPFVRRISTCLVYTFFYGVFCKIKYMFASISLSHSCSHTIYIYKLYVHELKSFTACAVAVVSFYYILIVKCTINSVKNDLESDK